MIQRLRFEPRCLAGLVFVLSSCGGGGGGSDGGGDGEPVECEFRGHGDEGGPIGGESAAPVEFGAFILAIEDIPSDSRVVVADFNEDGRTDAGFFAPGGGIYLADEFATLRLATPVDVGAVTPASALAGDFDEDGHVDVILDDGASEDAPATLLAGDGRGQLASRGTIGILDRSPIAADFDGDGDLDLAATRPPGSGRPDLAVRLGDGAGGFGDPIEFRIGEFAGIEELRCADMNCDGIVDLLADEVTIPYSFLGRIYVLLGDGGARFTEASRLSGYFSTAQLGDFDEDGTPDVVSCITEIVHGFPMGYCTVVLNDGTAMSWAASFRFDKPYRFAPTVDDFDGDGHLDIRFNARHLARGDGHGGFVDPSELDSYPYNRCLAERQSSFIGDFDGDGARDRAFPLDRKVIIARGTRNGGLGVPTVILGIDLPTAAVSGDFDEDGFADVVAPASPDAHFLRGDGKGGFVTASTFEPGRGFGLRSLAAADLNGDAHLDLVLTFSDPNELRTFVGDGTGQFARRSAYSAGGSVTDVALADVDADGDVDAVVTGSSADAVDVRLGGGDGSFGSAASFPAGPSPSSLVLADLDGDGSSDDVAVGLETGIAVLYGDGLGSLSSADLHALAGPVVSVAAADWNGDGLVDLIAASGDTASAGALSVLLGDGTGQFASSTPLPVAIGLDPRRLIVTDLNGDGFVDALTAARGALTAALGTGSGEILYTRQYSVSSQDVLALLLDADRLPDLVNLSGGCDGLSVILNSTAVTGP